MCFRFWWLVITTTLLLLCVVPSSGQQAGPSERQLHNQLYQQEQRLATAEKRQDKQYFQRALDDNLIYVAYNGMVFTKAKILQSLNYIDVSRYSIENVRLRPLGPNVRPFLHTRKPRETRYC